jgi:hypothetical protein
VKNTLEKGQSEICSQLSEIELLRNYEKGMSQPGLLQLL